MVHGMLLFQVMSTGSNPINQVKRQRFIIDKNTETGFK
jgi:hypothetical protein